MNCFICQYLKYIIINISECKEHMQYNYDELRRDTIIYYSEL